MAGVNFNRVCTIRGSSSASIALPDPYAFDDGYSSLGIDVVDDGLAWATDPIASSSLASVLAASTAIFYSDTRTADVTQTQPPDATTLNSMEDVKLYVLRSNGYIGLSFDVGLAANNPLRRGLARGFRVNVSNGRLVGGADFDVTDAPLGFDFDLTQYAETGEVEKRVWCRIIEQGGTAGLVRLNAAQSSPDPGSDASEGGFEEGAQEEVTVLTPYDEDIANGDEIVDDLGRVWTVSSSRTLNERRYIEYSAFRTSLAEEFASIGL